MTILNRPSSGLRSLVNRIRLLTRKNKKRIGLLKRSLLFDVDYYLWKNRVVLDGGQNAFQHYVLIGWKHGFDPHPLFRTDHYLLQTGSLNEPALCHYLRVGYLDKISPHPLFDFDYYYNLRPDVRKEGVEPISHYLE